MSRIIQMQKKSNDCGCGCKEREAKEEPRVSSETFVHLLPVAASLTSEDGRGAYSQVINHATYFVTNHGRTLASSKDLEENECPTTTFSTRVLGCIVPYHRVHEATDLLVREFERLVANGTIRSVLCQMSRIELAHPKSHDLMMYELFERIAPERVRGIEKPVIDECDRHAVFMFVHVDMTRPCDGVSDFLFPEGSLLKELPPRKMNEPNNGALQF
jgi:hypothetical protein